MGRQFVGILVARVLASGLQAVALVLLARNVEPTALGAVMIAVAAVGLVLVATGAGMSVYVPWVRARGEDARVSVALRVNTVSNLASVAVLVPVLLVWAVGAGLPAAVALVGVSLALERNADTLLGVAVADGNSSATVVSLLLRRLGMLAVMVPGLLAGVEPVLAYTSGLTVGAVAGQLHVRRVVRGLVGPRPGPGVDVGSRQVVREAAPFLVSNLTGQARTADVAIVGAVLGPAAAGVYSAAAKLVQPLLLVPQSLGAVLMPGSARVDALRARRLARRLVVAFLVCGVLATPLVPLGEWLVTTVMGERYSGGGGVLGWTALGLPFIALSSSLGAVLQGQGAQRLVAVNGAVFAVVLLVATAVAAALGGVTAAAAAICVSYVLRAAALLPAVGRLGGSARDTG